MEMIEKLARFLKKPATHNGRRIEPLDEEGRKLGIRFLTGGREVTRCDLCGERVTHKNVSGWDEDGHAYCTNHGPLATFQYID